MPHNGATLADGVRRGHLTPAEPSAKPAENRWRAALGTGHPDTVDFQLVNPEDAHAVAELHALHEAARRVDTPDDPPVLVRALRSDLRHGGSGEPPRVWLLRDGTTAVGAIHLLFPEREDLHAVHDDLVVHPDHRRRGFGRALFEFAVEQTKQAGRRLITTSSLDTSGPTAFAEAMGLQRASAEVRRRQDLTTLDQDRLADLLEQAREASAGYRLLRLVGTTPDELAQPMSDLSEAMNDAPTDDLEVEDEVMSPERLHAYEHAIADGGGTLYRLIAQRESDGELGGFSVVVVNEDLPEWGFQNDTGVARTHRGHRLGLLVKLEMLRWLAEEEPQVRWIDTWNAASNAHMIAINEDLGYRVMASYVEWQREL